jgi:hypothetical protein
MFRSAQTCRTQRDTVLPMTKIRTRFVATMSACAIIGISTLAEAQDLSRYRDVAFGSSVASVVATTRTNASAVKVVHRRPALIQEFAWRPQYAVGGPAGRVEAAQEIALRFYNDHLFSITVMYEARLVEGLTNRDIIDAVSEVYGPATLTVAASKGPVSPPSGTLYGSTALARWQTQDHEFTLMREAYPATYRLIGVSRHLEMLARAAESEAVRLDKQEAPRREAERAVAEAERKTAAAEKTRTTNKGEFRP